MKEYLALRDFLKIKGIVQTGGQAKIMIRAGEVKVNGEVDTRNKKKLITGDIVECAGKKFRIDLNEF